MFRMSPLFSDRLINAAEPRPLGWLAKRGRGFCEVVGVLLARGNLQVIGRAERRRFFMRCLKFFFGLVPKLLVSAIGLSGSLPEFVSSLTN
jgi:hypothetical protein